MARLLGECGVRGAWASVVSRRILRATEWREKTQGSSNSIDSTTSTIMALTSGSSPT